MARNTRKNAATLADLATLNVATVEATTATTGATDTNATETTTDAIDATTDGAAALTGTEGTDGTDAGSLAPVEVIGENIQSDGEAREPTPEEKAETDAADAIVEAAIQNATSIADASEKAFNHAAEGSESRLMAATSFLALRLVMQQAAKTLSGDLIEDSTDRFIFNKMLFNRVMAGKSIYRGDADAIAAVMATAPVDRKEAATAHVKLTGAKLNKTLALIRQYGFELAAYVRANESAQIRELAQAAQTGVGDKATLKAWTLFIVGEFGSTFSGLTHNLEARMEPAKAAKKAKADAKRAEKEAVAKAEAEKEEAAKAEAFRVADAIREESRDKVAEAMDIIATMTDAELASLATRLRGFMEARDGSADATPEAPAHDGETLELTAIAA